MKEIHVSQKALVINSNNKILAIKRSPTAPANPNSWDLPGGDLDFGEQPSSGILREIKEETNLEVENLTLLDTEGHINDKGEFWVTIAYTAKSKTENVNLSFEHSEFEWVTKEEFLKLKTTSKISQFVESWK